MRCTCGLVAAVTMIILLRGDLRAVATVLTDKDIERALKLAQAREDHRARFHAPYIVRVNDATLEQVEVITEFRRYVLTVEEKLRMGNWLFAQGIRGAQEALKPWRGRLSLVARLRFHPQNTLIGIPPYEIAIGGPDLAALKVERTPITALLSGKARDFNAPLMGATIEAVFDTALVGQTARPVTISLATRPVASVTIDFARLE
jgi:hypothetical protein